MNCEPNRGERGAKGPVPPATLFAGNAGIGLYIHRANGKAVADVSIEDSMIEDNDSGLVIAQADTVYVAANHVLRHAGRNKSGISLGEVTRAKVTANLLEGNSRGILSSGSSGVDIRDNTIVGTGPASTAHAGDSQDGILCLGWECGGRQRLRGGEQHDSPPRGLGHRHRPRQRHPAASTTRSRMPASARPSCGARARAR